MFFFVSNYENDCEKKKETKSGKTEYVFCECHENFVHSVVCLQKKKNFLGLSGQCLSFSLLSLKFLCFYFYFLAQWYWSKKVPQNLTQSRTS